MAKIDGYIPGVYQSDPEASEIGRMSFEDRLVMAIRAAVPLLPPAVGAQLEALLDPKALALALGVVGIRVGLQFTGVGEVADAVLPCAGYLALGGAAFQAGRELLAFAVGVRSATKQKDIDEAAGHLAQAVSLIGIQAVLTLLLHRAPSPYREPVNLDPQLWRGWWPYDRLPPRPPGKWAYVPKKTIVAPETLSAERDVAGDTSEWGDIRIAAGQSLIETQKTLFHERVHSVLTPKLYFLQSARVQVARQGYYRSVLLRYIEEAMAETYAQVKVEGFNLNALLTGVTFPIGVEYNVSLAGAGTELAGLLLGPINVGGMVWNVYATERRRK